jgi:hypothetical protein
MIVACQVMDPGSIPGERSIFFTSRRARVGTGFILLFLRLKLETDYLCSPLFYCKKNRHLPPGSTTQ